MEDNKFEILFMTKKMIRKILQHLITGFRAIKEIINQPILVLRAIKHLNKNGPIESIARIRNQFSKQTLNVYKFIEPVITPKILTEIQSFKYKPLISIIMPLYNIDPEWLKIAIKSIDQQWYENWELCIISDKRTNKATLEYFKNNSKIKVKFSEKNFAISEGSNEALKISTGEYLALIDNNDKLTPNALYEAVKTINSTGAGFIYSDEDIIGINEIYTEPHFKPDFAPDMFLSQNFIGRLCVIKRDLVDKVKGWTVGLERAQDYDLYLKVLEQTDKIVHIPKVLYHWRKILSSSASALTGELSTQEPGKKALENAMIRREIKAQINHGLVPETYKVSYNIEEKPLVSIIIPFSDKPELLTKCIDSILGKSTYENFEIIGVSNNSSQKNTFKTMQKMVQKDKRIRFIEYNIPFNYSKINNYAVKNEANGEHIILLNNDIEIITPEWIQELLMHSQRENIGAVGAKLYYPNKTIQHAGIIVGLGGFAGNSHNLSHHEDNGYFNRLKIIQDITAVTAACLMVKKDIYAKIDGLDEKNLKVAFNDVDFCLRIIEKGYKNIFTPYCEAYHHESLSRGLENTEEKQKRFFLETEYMQKRHGNILKNGDPYYNRNLSLETESFTIKQPK